MPKLMVLNLNQDFTITDLILQLIVFSIIGMILLFLNLIVVKKKDLYLE